MAEEQTAPVANQEQTAPAPAETAPQTQPDGDKPIINEEEPAKQDGDKPLMGGEEDGTQEPEKKAPEGAPEKYDAFTMPEGFQLDEGRMTETTALFKELNLTQGNAQKLVDAYCKFAKEQQTAEANQLMETRKAWRSEIRSREDFREQESLMRKGFRMLVKTDAQKRLFMNSWLQDSPELFDLFVAAGKLAAEDSMHPQAQTSKPTEAEINMQRFPNL